MFTLGREVWRLESTTYITGQVVPHCHCQGRKHAGTPKSVCMKLEASGCGCLCEVVGDWDVNKVENYPIQNGDSGLRTIPSQSIPALPKNTTGTAVYFLGCHHCAGHFLVFGASYAGGKHRLDHVDTTMYFYGEIRQCTCNWQWKLLLVWLTVSRVGDNHWRRIAGGMQQLAL